MIISIDIGTSYSSICMLSPDGKAHPVDISTGTSMFGSKYSLPSAVFVEDNGKVLVGQAAMNSRKHKPQNFRMEFKRNLGEDIPILLGGRSFKPEELYTELFRHMKSCAEKVSGETIEKTYLTYPASYGEKRREKLRSAAKAAGLFDLELVDEPTAAAMCYCTEGYIKDGQTLLVYDFGGGTFDVSLIKYQNNEFQLLSEPTGLERCGGMDIDYLVAQDMRAAIEQEIPGAWDNLQKNQNRFLRFTSQINELAVKAKHHLSSADVFEEYIEMGMDDMLYKLTVERFNEMVAPLVGQTVQACRRALNEAGISASDVSAVLMVGGTSRIPLVQELARKITGKPALCAADLELAVAQGALPYVIPAKKEDVFPLDYDPYSRIRPVIATGGTHTIGLKKDGTLVAVGANRDGQCDVNNWRDIVAISAAQWRTVGLKKDGTVVAVGTNGHGQCNVSGWRDIVAISAGIYHTVGLKKDGTVVAVGSNSMGACNVSDWRDIVAIAAGNDHTVGLKKDGTVVAAGYNSYKHRWGELNVGDWRDIVAIAAGDNHTVGLKKDGTVVATRSTRDDNSNYFNVDDWRDIVAIAAGNHHTVGLKKDGTVVATSDAFGDVDECNVNSWRDIVAISAGWCQTVGLKKDGTVIVIGDCSFGQTNDGKYITYTKKTLLGFSSKTTIIKQTPWKLF